MKKHVILSVIAILFFISSNKLFSQAPPMEWGKISKQDLEMKSYPQDTNACALYLCVFGDAKFNDFLDIEYNYHARIKIFNQKGYEKGTIKLVLYTKGNSNIYTNIKGATYLLDEKGNIVEHKLQESDIYKEDDDKGNTIYNFTLPSLQPGCVIEYRFTRRSESFWYMPDFYFQHDEPTRWAEFRMLVPRNISYATVTQGFEPYVIKEHTETTATMGHEAAAILGSQSNIIPCNYSRWAAQNLPALRDEPYITTIDDYRNIVRSQIAGYWFRGNKKQILQDWTNLNNELLDSKSFGDKIDVTGDVKDLAKELTDSIPNIQDKIRTIYNWVSKSIVWDGRHRVNAEQKVNETLKYKKGNSAEINFLLISLLRAIKIDTHPVIVSTRSNGKIQSLYPMADQFNYVIARTKIDTSYIYLDATSPLRPMELLPLKVLNVDGVVIKKLKKEEEPEWITVKSDIREIENSSANIYIESDGTINGKVEKLFKDYGALFIRDRIPNTTKPELAKSVFDADRLGLELDSITITNDDTLSNPVLLKANITSNSYAQSAGNMIYINPHIFRDFFENPFKTPARKFPIDFGWLRSFKHVSTINIPEGYTVKESITDKKFTLPYNAMSFTRLVQADSQKVTVISMLDFNVIEMNPRFYGHAKELFARIVATQSEQIVLEKIQKAEPAKTQTTKNKVQTKKSKK